MAGNYNDDKWTANYQDGAIASNYKDSNTDDTDNDLTMSSEMCTETPADSDTSPFVHRTPEECENEIRIVLIGRTGNGKSATGNSIMNLKYFEAAYHPQSVTQRCKKGEFKRGDNKVIIVDTPGLFDTKKFSNEIQKEIIKSISVSAPGPHAFLYVLSLTNRITEEEIETFVEFAIMFGEKLFSHVIFVFTGKDEIEGKNMSIEKFLGMMPNFFRKVLKKCHSRTIAFNNVLERPEKDKRKQVDQLFSIVSQITQKAEGQYFSHSMIQDAERVISLEINKILLISKKGGSKADENDIRRQIRENIRDKILKEDDILTKLMILFSTIREKCVIL